MLLWTFIGTAILISAQEGNAKIKFSAMVPSKGSAYFILGMGFNWKDSVSTVN